MRLAAARQAVATARAARLISVFEFWPNWLVFLPVTLHWIVSGLRHRSQSLPALVNPLIETGGLCCESKQDVHDRIAGPARALLADYVCFENTGLAAALAALARLGQAYPVVLKPDIGRNGAGVRLLASEADLRRAIAAYPAGIRLLVQEYLPEPQEAGVFYVREPGAAGRITSVTLKTQPCVVGDGAATLRDLILRDARAARLPHLYLPRLADRLDTVPEAGERVRLVFAGNHCRGSIFANGIRHVTPALTEAIDRLGRALPEYYFGRIDLRFASLADLRAGKFRVIEVNGLSSEPTHVWDPTTRLVDAWRSMVSHYAMAWRIAAANRARGFRPPGILALGRAWRREHRLVRSYPLND